MQCLPAMIEEAGAARDDPAPGEHGVCQLQPESCLPIFQSQYQCIRLCVIFRISRREPGKFGLAGLHPVIMQAEFGNPVSVFLYDLSRRDPVISCPKRAVFLFDMLH